MRACSRTRVMNIISAVCLLLELSLFDAASIPSASDKFYEYLNEKCPFEKPEEILSYMNENVFKHCGNWKEIRETTNLTRENENNVLCLLSFESFVSFCAKFRATQRKIDIRDLVPEPKVPSYTVDVICKNLSLIPADNRDLNISKIITQDKLCNKLCTDYYTDEPVKECSLAYYYSTYNATQVKIKVEPQSGKEENIIMPNVVAPAENAPVGDQSQSSHQAQAPPKSASPINEAKQSNTQKLSPEYKVLPAEQPKSSKVNSKGAPLHIPVPGNVEPVKSNQAANEERKMDILKVQTAKAATTQRQSTIKTNPNEDPAKPTTVVKGSETAEKSESNAAQKVPDSKNKISNPTQDETQENPARFNQVDKPMMDREQDDGEQEDYSEKNRYGADGRETSTLQSVTPKAEAPKTPKESIKTSAPKKKTMTTSGDQLTSSYSPTDMEGESYILSYFMVVCVMSILGYFGYHNRQKLLALVLEGKRGKRQYRSRRRPNSANYHKLDSNLEEAISSTCTKNTSHVIY